MIKLSVVIITFNEEHNIGRCLESVKDIADEVVVLDSFSTDKTEEICRSYGVQFAQHAFDGHIQQKNRAITYASNPYVLSLDADEAIDQTLQKSILEVKNNWRYDAYSMNRLTNYCGKWIRHGGWYPDRKLRLWDSRKGAWGGTNPHDKYELFDKNAPTGHLKGDILHYSFYSADDHYRQAAYFSDIAAKAMFKEGRRSNFFMIWFSPVVKFVKDYIFKGGFLDGKAGYQIAKISAIYTRNKYRQLKKLQQS
ncbi:MAG TPA: glycosyltransferase family 2 protein [Flavobacteriales bacterium]|nr:glycosyltransferase family 2 protein [Flavobacteriales bacterium]